MIPRRVDEVDGVKGAKGALTKESMRRIAAEEFRYQGFQATTLDVVGGRLGVSRAAVIHHFGSKVALLLAVVEPYFEALEAFLAELESLEADAVELGPKIVSGFVDAVIAHRLPAGILFWDIGSLNEGGIAERLARCSRRFRSLLSASASGAATQVEVTSWALLGAVLRAVTDPQFDPSDSAARQGVIDVGMAIVAIVGGRSEASEVIALDSGEETVVVEPAEVLIDPASSALSASSYDHIGDHRPHP